MLLHPAGSPPSCSRINLVSCFPASTLLCLPQRCQLSCQAPCPQRPGSQVNEHLPPKSQTRTPARQDPLLRGHSTDPLLQVLNCNHSNCFYLFLQLYQQQLLPPCVTSMITYSLFVFVFLQYFFFFGLLRYPFSHLYTKLTVLYIKSSLLEQLMRSPSSDQTLTQGLNQYYNTASREI